MLLTRTSWRDICANIRVISRTSVTNATRNSRVPIIYNCILSDMYHRVNRTTIPFLWTNINNRPLAMCAHQSRPTRHRAWCRIKHSVRRMFIPQLRTCPRRPIRPARLFLSAAQYVLTSYNINKYLFFFLILFVR